MKLTVIIRDESPLYINEPCRYRSVSLTLTKEQEQKLKLRMIGSLSFPDCKESIQQCFLESNEEEGVLNGY